MELRKELLDKISNYINAYSKYLEEELNIVHSDRDKRDLISSQFYKAKDAMNNFIAKNIVDNKLIWKNPEKEIPPKRYVLVVIKEQDEKFDIPQRIIELAIYDEEAKKWNTYFNSFDNSSIEAWIELPEYP